MGRADTNGARPGPPASPRIASTASFVGVAGSPTRFPSALVSHELATVSAMNEEDEILRAVERNTIGSRRRS
ncbi:hypothetical protein GUJ93_ZPchr0006g43824 [Zizania palustris]|uniref:Uncharacterized protein n=1 Tax=Zizania palustris TaxID=103762 RepID=A0A8J5TDE4_ZIZPA|nr:hypothetical protein GUJ93_ZPchr0006g43824 [Zizania palustris]